MPAGKRRVIPLMQKLDTLMLPSGTISAQVIVVRRQPRPLFDIHGETTTTQTVPGVGRTIRLSGDAWIDNQGSVPFTGNLTAAGFVGRGRAGGSIVFAGRQGAMTVALAGPVQPGPSSLPSRFNFRVIKANAEFAGFKGSGTAILTTDDAGRFALNFQSGLAKPRG